MIFDVVDAAAALLAIVATLYAVLTARRVRARERVAWAQLQAVSEPHSEPYSLLERVTLTADEPPQPFMTPFDAYVAEQAARLSTGERDPLLEPSRTPSNGQPVLAPHQLRAGWLPVRWVDAGRGGVGYQWECATCSAVGNLTVAMLRMPPWRWHRHFTRERLEGDTQ